MYLSVCFSEVAQDSSNDGDLNVTAEDEEEEFEREPPVQQGELARPPARGRAEAYRDKCDR